MTGSSPTPLVVPALADHRHVRYVGRVGALAVALGIGYAMSIPAAPAAAVAVPAPASAVVTAPPGPDARIVRGGSWSQGIVAVSSSTRRDYPSGYQIPGYLYYTDDDTGFRLAGAVDLNSSI